MSTHVKTLKKGSKLIVNQSLRKQTVSVTMVKNSSIII